MDTIEWTVVPETEVEPIRDRSAIAGTERKSAYNIALIAPFSAKNFQFTSDRLNARMSRMIEFYGGLKFGWQNYCDGVSINLSVIDSQKDPGFIDNFAELEVVRNADIIIGPYFTDILSEVLPMPGKNKKY